jgi:uncharacterized protein involved in propanediol utilization
MLLAASRHSSLVGVGHAHGHHGELLQGVFESPTGLVRALVTVPAPSLTTRARFAANGPELTVEPADRSKALRAAALAGIELTGSIVGGHLTLSSTTPVSRGFGSSTSDVVAAIRAVADCLGASPLLPERTARIAVAAETASDSVMFPGPGAILFAQRSGIALRYLGTLPPLRIVGTDLRIPPVPTLEMHLPTYTRRQVGCFSMLLDLLAFALERQDARLVGLVATASTRLNQHVLAKPELEDWIALGQKVGAVGTQVAHSGTLLGWLFDATAPDLGRRINDAKAAIAARGQVAYVIEPSSDAPRPANVPGEQS